MIESAQPMNTPNNGWQILATFTLSATLTNEFQVPSHLRSALGALVLSPATSERLVNAVGEAVAAMKQGDNGCIQVCIYGLRSGNRQVVRQPGWGFFLVEKPNLPPAATALAAQKQMQGQLDIYLYQEHPRL
jgi:hypothetical protein